MKRTLLAPLAAALLLSGSALAEQVQLNGRPLLTVAGKLKAGQYIWEPDRAPNGPALVVVNLHTQRLLFFRNGVPIAASTISSGKTGHETPTGVFTILQKNEKHFSKTYNNAPMPNMQRLTWKGIALHAGNLPGYPASHGCVRLPLAFSKLLFGETALGMTVVITSHPDIPHSASEPDLEVVSTRAPAPIANAKYDWHPERAGDGDSTIEVVVSKADHQAIVMKGDVKIGSAPVYVHGNVVGAEAYVLESWDKSGQHWVKLHFSEIGKGTVTKPNESEHFDAPTAFRQDLHTALRPGSIVVVTPATLKSGLPGTRETVFDS
ncbi:MAG: L,D-transpeptidase family protein [Myxococcales bacterium]